MKKELMKIAAGVFFVLIPMVLISSPQNKANSIIKKVLKKYNESANIKVDFSQVFFWKLTDNKVEQNGTIWLEGKEKFKIQTENQIVVSNGKTAWTYSQSTNQVIIDNIQNTEDINLPKDILLNFSDLYNSAFLKDEKLEGKMHHHIELNSKTGDDFIKQIKLWIDVKALVVKKIIQTDINENTNTYFLKNIEFNVDLPVDFFEYSPPDSAEVIDMR